MNAPDADPARPADAARPADTASGAVGWPRWRIDTIHAPTGDHHAWRDVPGRTPAEALASLPGPPRPHVEWADSMGARVATFPAGSRAYVFPQLTPEGP